MTSVNVTENKYSVSVTEGATTVVTAKAPGPQGIQGLGISAGDKGSLTVAANLTDWTLNDSVVTNAKVSASAGIQGTKISPDFGSQNITTTGNAVFGGDLTVSGTTTTIDTTTLRVEDKNIELGKVGSPTDITADGGGITLLGDTNHTFNWLNATDSWTSSEHIALPDNKKLQLGDSQDLQIFHSGSHSFIDNTGTGNLYVRNGTKNSIFMRANAEIILYYNDSGKLATSDTGITVSGNINLPDSSSSSTGRLSLGDNTDIQLYHDSTTSNNYLRANNGYLYLTANNLRVTNSALTESFIKADANGSVELYYDNVKKAETASNGLNVEGTVTCDDILLANSITHEGQTNTKISFDATAMNFISNGVQRFSVTQYAVFMQEGFKLAFIAASGENPYIRSTGTNNGDLEIGQGTESMAKFKRNGAVELHYDNSIKFTTEGTGVKVFGMLVPSANGSHPLGIDVLRWNALNLSGDIDLLDNNKLKFGDNNFLNIYHTSTGGQQSFIETTGGLGLRIKSASLKLISAASENYITCTANGSVELYHDNVKRCETSADGLNLPDNSKLQLGDSQDLRFYHTGSVSVLRNDTGTLYIDSNDFEFRSSNGSSAFQKFIKLDSDANGDGGTVQLFFDGSEKLVTSSSGITVTGSVTTQDMNMSNLNGTANEVDNTKGSWSIQEGADDLFIINRVSGKKYKFNLTEIS